MNKSYLHKLPMLSRYLLLTLTLLGASPSFADYFSEAKSYMDEGKYNYAIIQLKNLLKANPDHAQGRLLLGRAQLETGQYSAALKEFIRAKSLGVSLVELAVPMAHLALIQGNSDEVIKILSDDITNQVTNPAKARWLIGYAKLSQQKNEEALSAFEASNAIKPSAPAWVGLAKIKLQEKNTDTALKLLDKAISIDPNYEEAWFSKGRVLSSQQQWQPAISAFTSLLNVNPKHSSGLLSRSEAYLRNNQVNLATSDVKKALAIQDTNPMANLMQAKLHAINENYADAITSAEKVIKRLPDHFPALLLLGSTHFVKGSYQQSKFYLEKAISLHPNHKKANRLLAASRNQLGDPRGALDLLEKLDASQEHQDIALLDEMASAYFKLGQYQKGNEALFDIKTINPDFPGVNTRLALGKMALGEKNQALAFLIDANQSKNSTEQDAIRLIRYYLINKQWDSALKQANDSIKKRSASPALLILKSGALVGQNKLQAARDAANAALAINPNYVDAHTTLGELSVRTGKTQDAKNHYQKVLELAPGQLAAQLTLANMSLKADNTDQALKYLKGARNSNPAALQPISAIVQLYLATNEPEKALREAKQYQSRHRDQVGANQLLFSAYLAANKTKQAIEQIDTLIKLQPNVGQHRTQRILLLTKDKQFDTALAEVDSLLKTSPKNEQLLTMKARIQTQSNDISNAEKTIGVLATQFPKSHLPDQLRGDLKLHQKQPQAAYPFYQKAFDRNPTVYLLNAIVSHARKQQDYSIAIKALNTYLEANPNDIKHWTMLGSTYLSNGQFDLAQDTLEKANQLQPNNPVVLNNLAWTYWEQKNPKALEFAEKAHKLAPNNASIADSLGWITLHQGNPKKALGILKEVVSKEAFNPEIRYHYAVALHRNQQSEKAKTELKRLLRDFSSFSYRADAEKLLKELE